MVLYEGSPKALPTATPDLALKPPAAPDLHAESPGEVIALTAPAGASRPIGSWNKLAPSTAVYSGGAVTAPRTLLDIFFHSVDNFPDATALDDGVVQLTYLDVLNRIEKVSVAMREAGIGTGDRVGIRVPSGTVELYIAILAALYRGAAYVPVDHDEPQERARLVWKEASVTAVIESGLNVRLLPDSPPRGEDRPLTATTMPGSSSPQGPPESPRGWRSHTDLRRHSWTPRLLCTASMLRWDRGIGSWPGFR